ncbi:hypothetical protein APED_01385 [Acanthopleuribacter pedis]
MAQMGIVNRILLSFRVSLGQDLFAAYDARRMILETSLKFWF